MSGERALVSVERVRFDSAVDAPGMDEGVYPVRDEIFERHPLQDRARRRDPYDLWYDGDFVILVHPKSKLEERIPRARVVQLRLSANVKTAGVKAA